MDIENIRIQFYENLNASKSKQDLNALYLEYFSKRQGIITNLLKQLASYDIEEKKRLGPELNKLQDEIRHEINQKEIELKAQILSNPKLDLTYPTPPSISGMLHPTTILIREMNEFFRYYGFSIVEGPEIETAEYNFKKLNLPEGHPATDLQDTLFIEEPNVLLRTHTSSIEARVLTDYKPPIRAVAPGKVFRNETVNTTNAAFFHHYQGIVVEKGITMQHLKATLELFHKFLFGEDIVLRFRYKYYPEVSPGMGTDIKCKFCNGAGCAVCKYVGWMEVLGSGMIHYNTLKMCGIDPEEYTGFAFGMGLDRLVMAKFGIPDIRKLYGGGIVYK